MAQQTIQQHSCYKCVPVDPERAVQHQGPTNEPALESIDTTFSDAGETIFFASGYSAREVAQRHAREHGGRIYVNNISRNIKRRDLSNTLAPVFYAVANSPVYTLRGPDAHHQTVYCAYWRPL